MPILLLIGVPCSCVRTTGHGRRESHPAGRVIAPPRVGGSGRGGRATQGMCRDGWTGGMACPASRESQR
jgi:hypothetical protein